MGRTTIEPDQVTMIYGTGDPPARASFGSPTEKRFARAQKRTDIEKGYYAHTGQSKHKIKRPFYQNSTRTSRVTLAS